MLKDRTDPGALRMTSFYNTADGNQLQKQNRLKLTIING